VNQYDVVVVGTGPGGYVSAIRAAQLGLSGGDRRGRPARRRLPELGLHPDQGAAAQRRGVHIFEKAAGLRHHHREVPGRLRGRGQAQPQRRRPHGQGVEFLFRKNKITLFPGTGSLTSKNVVEVKGKDGAQTLEARRAVILGTGSEPKSLPGVTIDEKTVISSNGAVRNEAKPKSIVVIGAGAVGVEFADVYRSYGVEGHAARGATADVPIEDEEVSTQLTRSLSRRGIAIKTGVKVSAVKPGGAGVVIETDGGKLEAEQVADGRRPRRAHEGRRPGGARRDARAWVRQGLADPWRPP